jgi:glycosyltransferase involved in cell wall biosynthesis
MTRPILAVSNHGEIVGGGEISLLTLLERLDRSQWSPLAAVPSEGEVSSRCRALGLAVHLVPLPSLRRPGPDVFRSVMAMRRLIHESGARLLHANGSRAMFYAGLAGRLAGRPAIWHVRVADRDAFLDRFLGRLARAVIVNSEAVRRRLDWMRPEKVRCIHNGVDLDRFAPRPAPPALRSSLGLPAEAPVVASVGRFVRYKGYHYLLEAARLAREIAPDIHWVLVGDGELRDELEAQCQTGGMESRVRFTGWREDIPDILALCNLFVLPSVGEHFGRVLIEAMAMGKPIVATDAGGVPEIVVHGETGLLVPPADPRAFLEAVLTLLQDPKRRAVFGQAARQRAERRFSLTGHVRAVEALYQDLAKGESQGRQNEDPR